MKSVFIFMITFMISGLSWTQGVPPGQGAGERLSGYERQKKFRQMREEIRTPRYETPPLSAPEIKKLSQEAVFVAKVQLQFSPQVHSEDRIDPKEVTEKYTKRSLSLEQIRQMASEIERLFKPPGRLRAYVPEQGFERKMLYINIVPAKD